MRRPTKRDELGIVGIILTIVIVWALIAVVELTRTLEAAQSIDTRVNDITASVSGANNHLNTGCNQNGITNCSGALPILSTTESIVTQIDTAAKPLSAQAGQIITAATSINTTVSSILTTATDINGVVHSIGNTVQGIGSTVNSINSNLSGVNHDVVQVLNGPETGGGVVQINRSVDTILGLAAGIKGDTNNITHDAGAILTQAQGICADSVSSIALHLNIGLLKVC